MELSHNQSAEKICISAGKGNSLTSFLSNCRRLNVRGRGIGASSSISSFGSIRGRVVLSTTSSRTSINSRAEGAPITKHVLAPNTSKIHETDLEINKHRKEILQKINSNHVTIISAPTGTGKTTQVPQFIIDDALANGQYFNILVSQPRKIAAMSIAKRVADERECNVGELVGYQVGLYKKMTTENQTTKLLFCTTGVILEKLISAKTLSSYSHIILDEVHERETDMDLLLTLVRELMQEKQMKTKVILMSATMDPAHFFKYFTLPFYGQKYSPALVTVTTPRIYKNEKFFLNELPQLTMKDDDKDCKDPGIQLKLFTLAKNLIVERVSLSSKSVLVFLPGILEIKELHNLLLDSDELQNNCLICVLHSSLSNADQKIAFMTSSKPKIVLSTNIAESSVTITGPEVDCVIDFCLTKNLVRSNDESMASLKLEWASKHSLEQRAGRTGRTCDGLVYRLITRNYYDRHIRQSSIPEMLRSPLETVILRVKMLDVKPPLEFLQNAPDPPISDAILTSILLLKELGGLERFNEDGCFVPNDGKLTYVGRIMAALPLDVRVSKLIVIGSLYSLLDEVIIIGAGLNVQNIFRNSYRENLDDYIHKLAWSNGSGCDFIAILNAYTLWKNQTELGMLRDWEEEKRWCDQFNLNRKKLHEMRELICLIKDRLKELRLENLVGAMSTHWEPHEKQLVLKVVLAGAFIPHFHIVGKSDAIDELDAYKATANRNPFNTVIFKKMNTEHVGEVYEDQFKQKLVDMKVCSNPNDVKVTFDQGSTKIFVEFIGSETAIDMTNYKDETLNENLPQSHGRIMPEVYKAVKLSRLGFRFSLDVFMSASKTTEWALEHGFEPFQPLHLRTPSLYELKYPELVVVPTCYTKSLLGVVSHIDHCGKFFIQPSNKQSLDVLENIKESLAAQKLVPFEDIYDLDKGLLAIAMCDGELKRSKVLNFNRRTKTATCVMLDYGSKVEMSIEDLFRVGNWNKSCFDISERCFEATLCQIEPSLSKCPKGKWTSESIKMFREIVSNQKVEVEVFSEVNSVTSVNLSIGFNCVNKMMVDLGYAQECEEGFGSIYDNNLRTNLQKCPEDFKGPEKLYKRKINKMLLPHIPSPPILDCKEKIILNGPESPLQTTAVDDNEALALVDPKSVNSVLLRDDLHNLEGRLLVSAFATKKANDIIVHETTILPNIPGLPALLAMIFGTEVAVKRSKDKTRYAYVKFGLGYDAKRESLWESRDFAVPVNVELDREDFKFVNNLRTAMSALLIVQPNESIPTISDFDKHELINFIKTNLVKLIKKDRLVLPREPLVQTKGNWKFAIKGQTRELFEGGGQYHIIPYPKLRKPDLQECSDMIRVLKQSESRYSHLGEQTVTCHEFICRLCNQTFENSFGVQMHNLSKMHLNLRNILEKTIAESKTKTN